MKSNLHIYHRCHKNHLIEKERNDICLLLRDFVRQNYFTKYANFNVTQFIYIFQWFKTGGEKHSLAQTSNVSHSGVKNGEKY